MLNKYLLLPFLLALLGSCSSNEPTIHTNCQRDEIGNYILKWEITPSMEGTVSITVSDDPARFDGPATKYVNIQDGVTTYVTNDNFDRKYFCLNFNGQYRHVVGSRSVVMDSVQNVRDLGGYTNPKGKTTKWGKVFRAGQIGHLSEWDSIRLNNLRIKTIIDLRPQWEQDTLPCGYKRAEVISIPIESQNSREVVQRIQNGEIRKGDAFLAMQDEYIQFVSRNSDAFAKALRLFQEPRRYPILISCSFGKDQSGFLSMLLLNLLDMDPETIQKDYMSSNDYINTGLFAQWASQLSSDSQESVTVLLMAHEELIDILKHQVEKEYGSLDNYIKQRLRLSEKEQNKIKEILLY